MSLKMHFLLSHLYFFPLNFVALSDGHVERFHQDISVMEHRYKAKRGTVILGDHCWMMKSCATQQNTIDRPKGYVVNVSYSLFLFFVNINMLVLLSLKTIVNQRMFGISFVPCCPKT